MKNTKICMENRAIEGQRVNSSIKYRRKTCFCLTLFGKNNRIKTETRKITREV